MAVSKNVTVACDVCGKKWTFEERERPIDVWKRSVWVRLRIPSRERHILSLKEMDVCDKCMEMQTVLEGEADGTIEIENVRNVKPMPYVRQHYKLMDAIDSVPEEGGSL